MFTQGVSRFLVMLAAALYAVIPIYAQDPSLLQTEVTVTFRQATLSDFLDRLEEQSDIPFSYSPDQLDPDFRVDYRAENISIKQVLDDVLPEAGLEYRLVQDYLVIRPIRVETQPGAVADPYSISGYVLDDHSGEGLIGATLYLKDSYQGTITNPYGFYSLSVEPGPHTLVASYMGYEANEKTVNLNGNKQMTFRLEEKPQEMKAVVIRASETELITERNRMGASIIPVNAIRNMPAVFGEADVIKSLQTYPGVSFFGDGSVFYYVRGGNRDHNLVQIDEAIIFNPSHIFGYVSTFVPEAIRDMKFYKGDFPIEYGGRLGSLLDIRTREGNLNSFHAGGRLGLMSSQVHLEGPVKKEKSSFFLSGRHSHFGWLLRQNIPELEDLYFYDLTAKLNFKLGEKDRIYFSNYTGRDYFRLAQGEDGSGINWLNIAGTIRWNHVFGPRLFSNTTLYGSKYDYFLVTSFNQNDFWNAHIANLSLKTDFSFYQDVNNTLKFGAKLGGYNFNPGNFQVGGTDSSGPWPRVPKKTTQEIIVYAGHEFQASEFLTIDYGLRINSWASRGRAYEFTYNVFYQPVDTLFYPDGEAYNHYLELEPRIGANLRMDEKNSIKLAANRNVQNIHLISNSISPFTSLEVWLPSGPNILPQTATQFTLGYYRIFQKVGLSLSLEAYYKTLKNQIDYRDHAELLLNTHIENELRFGEARAFGLEFLLERNMGKFQGWLGYALGKVEKDISGLNQGAPFPPYNDRRHDLTAFLEVELNDRLRLSGTFIYQSGAAITAATGFYYYNGVQVPYYPSRNNSRAPAYHRMDLGLEWSLSRPERKYQHSLVFALYNVYGRENPIFLNYNKLLDEEGNFKVPLNVLESSQLVVSEIYLNKLVPSISYKFSF